MFSKKKKPDAPAAAPGAPDAATASGENHAAPPADANPAPPPSPALSDTGGGEDSSADNPMATGGGLLAKGLGSKAGKAASGASVAASRLGGRPPSRPSAPAPDPAPPPPEPPMAAPPPPAIPFGAAAPGTFSGQTMTPHSVHGDPELGKSGRHMAGLPQAVGPEEVTTDAKDKSKNPYKLNPLYDVLLPLGMSIVLCGGFAITTKIVKDKHDIYGYTEAERQTQVRDPYLASQKLLDDLKKMDPLVKMEAGDAAGALGEAKDIGAKALQVAAQQGMGAPQKGASSQISPDEVQAEEKAVKDLLCAGMVLCKVGATKTDKELGLKYMQRAEEIATYSKFVRILLARELVRAHQDDTGIAEYENIIKLFLDPWIPPHKEVAQLYMRANRGADAVRELEYLIKADPTDPSYQRLLGLAMAQNGDQQNGFEEFQKGFTHEQDVLNYPAAVKGLVEAHGGLVDATLADVKKAADKNPADIKLQLDLARLYIATAKFKEARDVMELARKSHELDPEVHEVMAEVMCRQNQQSSGYDEFRSSVQNLHLQQ